jgi:glucose/arabinose dehydrogenase
VVIPLLVVLCVGQPAGFEYIKKDTRQATRDATLAGFVPPMTVEPWYVIGPFDNSGRDKHDVVYAPETRIDVEATHHGKDDREIRWRRVADDEWVLHNLQHYGNDGIAYLYRQFECGRNAVVDFEMGSDDGLKLWVNGRVVVDADVYRGFNISDHRVKIPLREGRNTILAKVTQGGGGWQFQMRPRLDPRVAAWLDYHLDRDFPRSAEDLHYRVLPLMEPEGVVLEVGGLDVMPDGRPIVTTRRGEVWIVDQAYDDPPFTCEFKRFALGLHEPLGALWHDGGLYVAQRGELTKLIDENGDDRVDILQTISDRWGVSGNYHEFAFGPKLDGEGRLWVTLNIGFCGSLGKSIVPWRGWAVIVNEDRTLTPVCGGLRSPNGIGRHTDGAMFFTDNQGDWVGTNKLSHLDFGDWHGHPSSNRWYESAGFDTPRGEVDFKPPAIWFPYDRMGRSASDIVVDDTGGGFGPFEGQMFVGDQYAASVMRVFLEQVDGVYQGACFPFREGLACGVNRMAFGADGSMFVGQTNRGWWSFGSRPWGLQRIVFTGLVPFEVKTMEARPDGFELTFTQRVDPAAAADAVSYRMSSFTYHRHEKYGSDEIDRRSNPIRGIEVADDGLSVRLRVDDLRPGYVHELMMPGVTSVDGKPLLHGEAYYTLNRLPR